jgi:cytochrome c
MKNLKAAKPYQLLITASVILLSAILFWSFKQPATETPANAPNLPDSTRFSYTTLAAGFDEPMQMAVLPDLSVLVAERKGGIKLYDVKQKSVRSIAHLNVFSGIEDGLLGVAIDPDFASNHWVYFYNSVGGERSVSELARYEFKNGQLNMASKKVLLEIPTQRIYCCHSAGHLKFDTNGLLYLSTGDNTNAEEIEGHNPTDERPGRHLSDGQASSANSNDYRGKILRIKPEADGSYSIPDGNLFPKDGSKGKPEIYIMGCRNPFRISIDSKTGFLYWGDVGPDTEIPAEEGKLSYDEINQARQPGFFGYPYFLGANEAFPKYDFETKKEGPKQNPEKPINNSPNNTGVRELPPAQPAFIWYGKGPSKRWPLVGKGGASAMAGPVYHLDDFPNAPYRLPAYYDGKLFIYDWVRKWIFAVTLDQNGNYASMEPFLPNLKVVAPIDMTIAPDGAIYLLAYGTNWFAPNTDAGILRIEYSEGNRNPIAVASVSSIAGAAPLTVEMSSEGTKDFDAGDKLSYQWTINGKKKKGQNLKHTFKKPGTYTVVLTVSDNHGGTGSATQVIKVGNEAPVVQIETNDNRSFYWDNGTINYELKIHDKEDKPIDESRRSSHFDYLDSWKDLASVLSKGSGNLKYSQTETFYGTLDCSACHQRDSKSIGPSLIEVAKRYEKQPNAVDFLATKIIEGGAGNWGTYPMPPHPTLEKEDASRLAEYILSMAAKEENIALKGSLPFNKHSSENKQGAYVLFTSYRDGGANGIEPMSTQKYLVLRHPLIQLEEYEEGNVGVVIATKNNGFNSYIANITHGKFVRFNNLDLQNIRQVKFRVQAHGAGGKIVMRSGSRTGEIIGELPIPAGKVADLKTDWLERNMPVKAQPGLQDLFLTFENEGAKGSLFHVDWMLFER